jgi:hypothetical protein
MSKHRSRSRGAFGFLFGILFAVVMIGTFPAQGAPIVADGSVAYADDFRTQKVAADSYSHSPISTGAGIPEAAYLIYQMYPLVGIPEALNPVLVLSRGTAPGGAYVGYELLPPGATVLTGSIVFDRPDPDDAGAINVRYSPDGSNWQSFGQSLGAQPVGRHTFNLPAGAEARYVELRGGGLIDNLTMFVTFVPEPGTSLALLAPVVVLLRRPGTRASSGLG